MKKCGNCLEKCLIYAGSYKVENYYCGVVGCNKKKGRFVLTLSQKLQIVVELTLQIPCAVHQDTRQI